MGGPESSFNLFKINGGVAVQQPGAVINATTHTASKTGVSSFSDWAVGAPPPPTAGAAAIGGHVMQANGRGISGAIVTLVNPNGSSQTTRTNPFGYYRFADIPVGETYTLTARAKGQTFSRSAQSVNLQDDAENVNFTALP